VLRDSSPSMLGIDSASCDVLTEMQVGMRIPDLLLVFRDPAELLAPVKLSYFECALLAFTLRTGTSTVTDLAAATYASREDVETRVGRLAHLGFLKRRGDEFTAAKRIGRRVRIIAVEAKLTRWKEALVQAEECRRFANEAYIAMPQGIVRNNLAVVQACASSGVGIIAVDEHGPSVLLDAERSQPQSAEWIRVMSSAVGLPQMRPTTSSNAARQAR
jgi:DNA-binding MarR family transcriptional regulator